MGRRAKGRKVNGILLLDKPAAITSNGALQHVKRLFSAQKAGHTGSLDSLATGLLPICFGQVTKLSSFLLNADKSYFTTCKLGITTDTGDATGEVLQRQAVPTLTEHIINDTLSRFIGDSEQIPPMYSALKHNGQRLYALARQGIEVERQPRQICIYDIQLHRVDKDTFDINVHCSKGTYIRTLVEDIGAVLGCGAHVSALRRLSVGPFDAVQMVSAEQIEAAHNASKAELDALLLPADMLFGDLQMLSLSAYMAHYLCQGQAISVPHAPTSGLLRLYDKNQHFLGLGEVLEDGRVAPRRMFRE